MFGRLSNVSMLACALAASAALTSGCVVHTLDEVQYHEVVADAEPPPPQTEAVPEQPDPTYIWTPGYWYWSGGRYIWVSGVWRRPPVVGHVWVGGSWVVYDGRYRYVPGRWSAPARYPRYHYVHPRPHYYPRPRPVGPRRR